MLRTETAVLNRLTFVVVGPTVAWLSLQSPSFGAPVVSEQVQLVDLTRCVSDREFQPAMDRLAASFETEADDSSMPKPGWIRHCFSGEQTTKQATSW